MKIGPWTRGWAVWRSDPDRQTRSRFLDALHVFVLFNFAVAQPVYDRLSERASLFVDQAIGLPVAYTLVAIVSAGLPAAIVLLERLAGCCSRRCYETLHCVAVALFLFVLALPVCKQISPLYGSGMISCAAIGSALGTRLYFRFRPIRSVVTLASLGIVIFPVIFLLQFSANFVKVAPSVKHTERWQPVPVVVLVFDEFCGSSLMTPEREIDAQRFPNFATLARDSTWFRNATSVNQNTVQALPAILSGKYPTVAYAPISANLPQNLFSIFVEEGFDQAIFEPVSSLARPVDEAGTRGPQGLWLQTGFVANFLWRVYLYHLLPIEYHGELPTIPRQWFGLHENRDAVPTRSRGVFRYEWTDRRDGQFRHFLKCLDGSDKPTLYFMHCLLPHLPWCYLPSGSLYVEDGPDWQLLSVKTARGLPGNWGPDELELINNQQRYLLQLLYVDQLVGKLIARLKATGLYDRCLLVVTADHGISFRANQSRRGIVPENIDEILSVPMFIKRPGQQQGTISDQDVESVDILPTIADVLGMALGREMDGWSVFDTSRPPRTRKTFGDARALATVDPAVIRNSKVPLIIRDRFGEGSGPESLFQISQIPELIGRRVESLKLATTAQIEMEFLSLGDEVRVGKSRHVPCLFAGRLPDERTADAPTVIAIAVNGTIHAVTRTYLQSGVPSRQWSAMVPESAFHAGHNAVRCYKVTGTQPDWLLTPCVPVAPVQPAPRNERGTP